METKADFFTERLIDYGVSVVKLTTKLNSSSTGRVISKQLLRSGTSVGANYEEARGAQSKADFIHKLQIVLKEIRESLYWLRLTNKSNILNTADCDTLINETIELSNIIAKSILTAKNNRS